LHSPISSTIFSPLRLKTPNYCLTPFPGIDHPADGMFFYSFKLNGRTDRDIVLDIYPSVIPTNASMVTFCPDTSATMEIVGATEAATE
jgi:hypothetical protein